MTSQKTKFTLWLTTLLVSALFVSGCGGTKVELGFPLNDGNTWTYQGTVTYQLGKQQQSMPALTFQLHCRKLSPKHTAPLELTLVEETEPIWKGQFVTAPQGLLNPLTGEFWLPAEVIVGKKWNTTFDGDKVTFIVRSQTNTTVPAGTFPTYLIDFKGPKKGTGSFWLDPVVGAVALDWNSKTPGGQSKTHLELVSYDLP